MAKRPTLTDITAGFASNTQLNANFDAIEVHFDNFLSRNGDTPNQMEADLDMNSNDILNVGTLYTTTLFLDGKAVVPADLATVPDDSIDGTSISLASEAHGDIMYFDGTDWVVLAAGTSGEFLKTQGAGSPPVWDSLTSEPSDGDKGDITVTASGLTWTIDSGVITVGKLASPTGADTNIVTGTAGADGQLAGWNTDGDVVDSGYGVLDEDTLSSDSATDVPTQQSVKAYVDTNAGGFTLDTAVTLTTQTSVDFTGIPSGVNMVKVMAAGLSSNGSDHFLVQLGDSGGIESSGYLSRSVHNNGTGSGDDNSTSGFIVSNTGSGNTHVHVMTLTRLNGNQWVAHGILGDESVGVTYHTRGSKTLSGELTQLRFTTTGGTNQLDAGTLNISYTA